MLMSTTAHIWPLPQHITIGETIMTVSKNFRFFTDSDSEILARAAARYEGFLATNATDVSNGLQNCSLAVVDANDRLKMQTSYRYVLSLSGGNCYIQADTIFGAVYGMESLYQLGANGTIPQDVHVDDFPDYSHRGLMIDTGRRFWPVSLVKNTIDLMSFNKMNVLHLHASDMCRFAVESKLFPELTKSLGGVKSGYYTQEDI